MKKVKTKIRTRGIAVILLLLPVFNLMPQSGWYPLQSGTSNVLNSVFFINSNTGFMAGNNIVLKSLNGGTNWLLMTQSFGGSSVYFINSSTGIVCDGSLYRTSNGGSSWINLDFSFLNSVFFVNSLTGYAAGSNSQILITADAGLNWFPQPVTMNYNNFNKIRFINSQVGFAVGGRMYFPYYGVIYKTNDGGGVWQQIDPSAQDIEFTGIAFPNSLTGYIVGRYEYGSSGVLYKTTNGGDNWSQVGIYNKDLNDVYFPSANVGYAVGEDGTVLKTTDGSSLWTLQQSNTTLDINSVFFLQDDLGFIAGNSGSVHKTQNGGIAGPPFAIAGKVYIQGIGPASRGIVKAVKYNSATNSVQVVDSAGVDANGDYIMRNLPRDSVDIFAYPDDEDDNLSPPYVPTYYASPTTGTIFWQDAQKIYVNGNLFNMNVYAFPIGGPSGSMIVSGGVYTAPPENGNGLKDAVVYAKIGNVFKGFSISRNAGVYDVNNIPSGIYTFICDRMGYRNAQRDTIVATANIVNFNFYLTNINVIGITPISSEIPKSFRLNQNYPNPFNPVTNVNLAVPVKSFVKLAVFDMLGREIETLINEDLSPGTYKVTWDATKFSSGIYFCKLATKDYTDTKKMILIK